MADKRINELPASDGLTDNGLLVVYQNEQTQRITGEQIKRFARESDDGSPFASVDYVDKKVNDLSNKKLNKLTLEHWVEKNFGSTDLLYIGKFGVYDSQLTVDITATTGHTYSGKLVIAAQNYQVRSANVYGDASNTIAPNIYIKPCTTTDKYVEIYFKPQPWSKNAIHIYGVSVSSSESVCTSVAAVPETATLQPVNVLTETFAGKSEVDTLKNVVSAVGQAYEETADAVRAITPYVEGETLKFGGVETHD